MSEGAALVRFHDWRAHGLVAVPVSIGLATLVLAVEQVMLLHPAAYSWCRSSAPVVDLPDHQGDLPCRARVGEVSCAFL
jgi:hypothetical protein